MSILANDVSIKLSYELIEWADYEAFTSISADILVCGAKAGSISGTIVNRRKIPERFFLSAMDAHSEEFQWVSETLFEPRHGRTKLRSLRDGGDDHKFDFMYIDKMHVDYQYKSHGNSNVGAYALRQLLHHPYIKGRAYANTKGKHWSVSSCIYILDPYEAMSEEVRELVETEERLESDRFMEARWRGMEKPIETEESLRAQEESRKRIDSYSRLDANQFLRNGFYQDEAVASQGGKSHRFLVAAHEHWNQPLKSHAEASAVQFYVVPPEIHPPIGKDHEILELTKTLCIHRTNILSKVRQDSTGLEGEDRALTYVADVLRLIRQGGSLARSNALHAACVLNHPFVVECILQIDPTTLESRDVNNVTPLIIAASTAAGKSKNDGSGFTRDAHIIIDILVAAGANKGAVDPKGMTAYGIFKQRHKDYCQMMQVLTGTAVQSEGDVIPGLAELEAKLMPPGGPTAADDCGGETSEMGFIKFREED